MDVKQIFKIHCAQASHVLPSLESGSHFKTTFEDWIAIPFTADSVQLTSRADMQTEGLLYNTELRCTVAKDLELKEIRSMNGLSVIAKLDYSDSVSRVVGSRRFPARLLIDESTSSATLLTIRISFSAPFPYLALKI